MAGLNAAGFILTVGVDEQEEGEGEARQLEEAGEDKLKED